MALSFILASGGGSSGEEQLLVRFEGNDHKVDLRRCRGKRRLEEQGERERKREKTRGGEGRGQRGRTKKGKDEEREREGSRERGREGGRVKESGSHDVVLTRRQPRPRHYI